MVDETTLHEWMRTQSTKQTVHIVECCCDYEGSEVFSVHATLEGAQAEAKRADSDPDRHRFCDKHVVSHAEVRP